MVFNESLANRSTEFEVYQENDDSDEKKMTWMDIIIYIDFVPVKLWFWLLLSYHLGDNTFVIEWFAGINCIILRSQI